MSGKPVARVGDTGSHGGSIIDGSPAVRANNRPIALVGSTYNCPVHAPNPIVTGAPYILGNDVLVAHVGSKTACGAEITSGSPDVFINNDFTAGNSKNNIYNASKENLSLQVCLKNKSSNIDEYLPFSIKIYKIFQDDSLKQIDSSSVKDGNIYTKELPPDKYFVELTPCPPDGESLGPVPIEHGDFKRVFNLFKDKQNEVFWVTRKAAIEHNIMMTFKVDKSQNAKSEKEIHEIHFMNYNKEASLAIKKYSTKFNIDQNIVNAILYMETTRGWYDGALEEVFPDIVLERTGVHKSIRPMNINIEAWSRLIKYMGLNRDSFYNDGWFAAKISDGLNLAAGLRPKSESIDKYNYDVNLMVGCFMLHRIIAREKSKDIENIATLYNNIDAIYVNDYGMRVLDIYNNKMWRE